MFAFGSVNWARPTIHTSLHTPYMILRSRSGQPQPMPEMRALENGETCLALENGAASASKRDRPLSDDEDERTDVQEAAQQKKGRVSISSRPVLASGTSTAMQLGVLVK